jgi:hypothetical protein
VIEEAGTLLYWDGNSLRNVTTPQEKRKRKRTSEATGTPRSSYSGEVKLACRLAFGVVKVYHYTYGSEAINHFGRMNEILSPVVAGVGRSKCIEVQVQRALDSAQRGVREAAEKSIGEDGYGLPKYNHHLAALGSSSLRGCRNLDAVCIPRNGRRSCGGSRGKKNN